MFEQLSKNCTHIKRIEFWCSDLVCVCSKSKCPALGAVGRG